MVNVSSYRLIYTVYKETLKIWKKVYKVYEKSIKSIKYRFFVFAGVFALTLIFTKQDAWLKLQVQAAFVRQLSLTSYVHDGV